MNERLKDILTWPNFVTATRLTLSPLVAKKLHDNPAKWWLPAGVLLATDGVDGFLAKTGSKSERLYKLGFRKSEFGRKFDPFVDKIVTSETLVAGLKNDVVPQSLGSLALVQKAAISAAVLHKTAEGEEIHVSELGRRSELLTDVGFGLMFAAENIDDPQQKHLARTTSAAIALTGIAGALAANRGYISQATA